MSYKDKLDFSHSKICETCKTVFYKHKCVSKKAWETRKFCSWACRRYEHKPNSKSHKKYDNVTFYTRCFECNQILDITIEYYFYRKRFCSKSCSAKYNASKISNWTEERRKIKSTKQKEKVRNGTWINPIHMEGAIEKIKETKRTKKKFTSWKYLKLQSEIASERLISGNNENLGNKKFGSIGKFFSEKNNKEFRYRSGFEKRAYEILEKDDSVLRYKTEALRIPYILDNKPRNYIPDILVTYKDGDKKIIEVKPLYRFNESETVAKKKAAEEYCTKNNIKYGYEMWSEIVLFRSLLTRSYYD